MLLRQAFFFLFLFLKKGGGIYTYQSTKINRMNKNFIIIGVASVQPKKKSINTYYFSIESCNFYYIKFFIFFNGNLKKKIEYFFIVNLSNEIINFYIFITSKICIHLQYLYRKL